MRWNFTVASGSLFEKWDDVPELQRNALMLGAAEAAVVAGATLRSPRPERGHIAVHGRDGKTYPCGPRAVGSRPAWLWRGDIP